MKRWFLPLLLLAGASFNGFSQCCPPNITTQPQSTTNFPGTTATFWAVVGSSTTVTYQWKFNGANVAGATATNYIIPSVQASNAGSYTVACTNSAGFAISSNASLVVLVANDNFANRIALTGTDISTSGSNQLATKEPGEPNIAGNPGGASVWWTWTAPANGLATVNTIGSSFDTLLGVYTGNAVSSLTLIASDNDSGGGGASVVTFNAVAGTAYQIVVDGSYGATGNITLSLSEQGAPIITTQPPNLTRTLTGNAVFTVVATGAAPLSYQWRFMGTNIPGATGTSLTLNNVQAWQAGTNTVVVSNAYGTTNSSNAVLTVNIPVGSIACWGDNTSNKATVQAGASAGYRALAAGGDHSLGLKTNGVVIAWGANGFGQTNVPLGLTDAAAIAAGYDHSLALRSNGTVVAWGDNTYGATDVPLNLSNVVSISAGAYHNLALKSDGTVVAWGYDLDGETDVPPGLSNVVQIAAGYYHNLALLKNGAVVCWGDNSFDQNNVPPGVANAVAALSCGNGFCLALLTNGTVTAWGDNVYGQTNVPSNANIAAIAAGGYHSLALKTDGNVIAWGHNTYAEDNVPYVIGKMIAIAAGAYHSMALQGSGAPYITVQPASQHVPQGSNAPFFVMAASRLGAFTYQWQFNGANIASATRSTYVRTNVQLPDAGAYTVILSNVVGMTTSSVAVLTVDSVSSFMLTPLGFASNGFRLQLSGPPGTYIFDASTDLSTWNAFSTNSILSGSLLITDPAAFSLPARYYRARQ